MGDTAGSPSAQAPRYGGSVFISYARADDEKPPFEEAVQGWVTFFWHQLRWELTNAGVHQAELWLDRYQIEPAEAFTERIEEYACQPAPGRRRPFAALLCRGCAARC
jgi:hypothetical protein